MCRLHTLFFAALIGVSSTSLEANAPLTLPTQAILGSAAEHEFLTIPISRHTLLHPELTSPNAGANISEALQRVPGLTALNRQNYAQDLQISSRGFGARAQFGVRGVRLIQDGIPLTMADGQGQPALFDLDELQQLEVIRGPLSTLYGNASGGIIQGFTRTAPNQPTLDTRSLTGSDGLWRSRLRYGAQHDELSINANLSRLHTDGYREHSKTQRDLSNLRLGWNIDDNSNLTLLLNHLEQPHTQDPLGLTREQVQANRRQATAQASTFNTRKSVRHQQAGLHYQRQFNNTDQLTLMAYGGQRSMQQYLAFAGNSAGSGGGVVELARNFSGAELGWQRETSVYDIPVTLTAGLSYNDQGEDRKGFVNDFGRKGLLMRDEFNKVDSQEAYLISTWQLAPRWTLTAGARHSHVRFNSTDHYLHDGQDDSGHTDSNSTNPAIGLSWLWTPQLSLYAALGTGFETPTFQELAYQSQGSGMNRQLKPSTSHNAEVGLKWRSAQRSIDIALFDSRVKDEIVTGPNQRFTGRATYVNAARSNRQGVELSIEQALAYDLSAYAAYTWLDARFKKFANSSDNYAGNQLPGIAQHSFFAELLWQPQHVAFHTALEAQGMSQRYATDDNQHSAAGYVALNWRAAYQYHLGGLEIMPFVRVDNLTNKDYIGSLIINGAGNRYYEPAPLRTWLLGLGLEYQW